MTNLLKSLLIITTLVTPTSVFNHSLETHTEVSKLALNISQTYKVHYADTLVIVKVAKQAAEQFELPLNLVLGVMAVESSFNHSAVSKQGALGLMQIHSSSGVSVGEDIEEHIYNGVAHLKEYINRFGTSKGVQAYNMGAGNIVKGKTNMKYFNKVLAKAEKFRV